jgi:hypothetical protein
MQFEFLAVLFLYGGPDQIMTVTSGLASLLGILLIFWNKVVGLWFRAVRAFRRSPDATISQNGTGHKDN